IAYEKGGIIKNGIPIFIGDLPFEAEKKIVSIAKERSSELIKLNDSLTVYDNKFDLQLNSNKIEISHSGLRGEHQLKNSALAIKVINKIFNLDNHKLFQIGLDNVVANSGIQGRYEKFGDNNNIIFDAAHNTEGIEIFLREFKKEAPNYSSTHLIFGAMNDKYISEMLSLLQPYFKYIHVTSTNYERAATAEEIKEIAEKKNINVSIIDKPEKLVKQFLDKNLEEILVVIGSIYLMGDIKRKLGH
ncbi:MAG: hypothetical protein OQJ81_10930, partial [Melioribacteraceae bacterium]|nr:hypothetical protein [Melioribacteraceae bacterium]